MKRLVLAMVLLLIPAIVDAAGLKDSGNRDLNRFLEGVSVDVHGGRLNRAALNEHVKASFGLDQAALNLFARQRLEPGEVYLVGLIHKATNRPAASIVKTKRSGSRSWKDVSYFLGSSPNELNAMRLADEKAWKRSAKAGSSIAARSGASRSTAKGPVISSAAPSRQPPAATPVAKTMTVADDGGKWDCTCRPKRK